MIARRTLRLSALATLVLAASPVLASGPALVVDVDSGRVLHAERATDPWFPASVTKLMTAYVVLKEIQEGRKTADSVVTMSPLASSMPPSKMGFKPGTELTLDNALKIIMVKSANDVSVAIAESVGGSVEGFADMMNAAAQRLGMRESRFVNPHGLPDERQQTSARDMAMLGRALLLQFPQRQDLFSIDAIQLGKKIMRNHNGLMGRYPGADGMKTGFICASGFNVVASATRSGRRLITVVMGSLNATERTFKAAALFDQGFAASSFGFGSQRLEDLPASAAYAPPNMRPVVCERRGPLPSEEDGPALTASASGNSDNPALAMFAAPSSAGALAFAPDPATGRLSLPPRGPLNPVQIWIGRRSPSSMAEKPVAAKPSIAAVGPAGAATAAGVPTPAARAAIRPNATPGAAKPRLGAIGSEPASPARPKPGAVTARPAPPAVPPVRATAAPAVEKTGDAVRAKTVKPAAKPAAKPTAAAPARPAAAKPAAPARPAAAKPAARPAQKPAAAPDAAKE
jgi:D-alanyl-D-alanine carboxypeptidase